MVAIEYGYSYLAVGICVRMQFSSDYDKSFYGATAMAITK